MNRNTPKSYLGIVVILGALWGLSEAALGMWLRSCASSLSGSLMTGVALFFIASSWVLTRNFLGLTLLIVTASLFKMVDALLLSLPVLHGAIANPIFAFIMEGAAFLVLVAIVKERLMHKTTGQALTGGMAALLTVNLFPLVKYATGIPACVFPGTGYPLSLYYLPVAVSLSFVTVPFGFWVGAKIRAIEIKFEGEIRGKRIRYLVSPATLIICLTIMVFIRLN